MVSIGDIGQVSAVQVEGADHAARLAVDKLGAESGVYKSIGCRRDFSKKGTVDISLSPIMRDPDPEKSFRQGGSGFVVQPEFHLAVQVGRRCPGDVVGGVRGMGQPGINIREPVIPFQSPRSGGVNIEPGVDAGQDRGIGRHKLIDGIALYDGIRAVGKNKVTDVIIESPHLEADVLAAVAVGYVDLIPLFRLQVYIAKLESIGADIQTVAGELVNGWGPKAFRDIELYVLAMRQLVGGAGATGPAGVGIGKGVNWYFPSPMKWVIS